MDDAAETPPPPPPPPPLATSDGRRVVTHHPLLFQGRTYTLVETRIERPPYEVEVERRSRLIRHSLIFRPESDRSCKRSRVAASGDAVLGLREARAGDAGTPAECAVCLQGFVAEDRLRALPCSHAFHQDCIFRWLRVSHVCPLCRHALPTEQQGDEGEEEDEDEDEDYGDGDYQQDDFDENYR
ncbi:hypothetical protein BAE44_0020422 [Dichanthelium oligosanthes]|uniref:RING-type domain-containing protein n=1 Tax=Dichanthelium oligosanthes TaxID=888268 RepID=A0A1E5V0D1_9POAL|nr:hypothetical protein BAE44_0020422 [Dichanthelium oligosanthes]